MKSLKHLPRWRKKYIITSINVHYYSSAFPGTWENKPSSPTFSWNYVMFPQFKSFEALQTVKSSIVSLCMIFKSIFEDSKLSYLIETKGLPIAFAQVLRISKLYILSKKTIFPCKPWFWKKDTFRNSDYSWDILSTSTNTIGRPLVSIK